MDTFDLTLDLSKIENDFPENPIEFFKGKKLCLFKAKRMVLLHDQTNYKKWARF